MKKHTYYSLFLSLVIIGVLPAISFATTNEEFSSDLYFGINANKSVVKLQNFLIANGFYSGPTTGNFYSLTEKAVKNFQKANGIIQTGYFGALSRVAANKIKVAKLILVSPTNVTTVEEGVDQKIIWASENYLEGAGINIYLLRQTNTQPKIYELVKRIRTETLNDGIEIWRPQVDEVGENMIIQIGCSSNIAPIGCVSATSNNTFALLKNGVTVTRDSNLANTISAH